MKYFMQTTRFNPKSFEMMGFIKKNDTYILKEDGSLWKEASLYDLGYGKERGLYRLPELDFKELCSLAFVDVDTLDSDGKYNYWGSMARLVDLYLSELLEYIEDMLTNHIDVYKKYYVQIEYLNTELNYSDDILNKISDKSFVNNVLFWRRIKTRVFN